MTDKNVKEEAPLTVEDENHIIAERRAKLAALREKGVAYPNDFVRKDLFGDLRAKWGLKPEMEGMGICILGYIPEGVTIPCKARKEGYIIRD